MGLLFFLSGLFQIVSFKNFYWKISRDLFVCFKVRSVLAAYMSLCCHILLSKFIKSSCCPYTPFLLCFFSPAAYEQCFKLSKCLIVCSPSGLLFKSPYFHLIDKFKQQEGLGRLKTTTGTGPMFCNVKYSAISISIFACAIEDSWLKTFVSFCCVFALCSCLDLLIIPAAYAVKT